MSQNPSRKKGLRNLFRTRNLSYSSCHTINAPFQTASNVHSDEEIIQQKTWLKPMLSFNKTGTIKRPHELELQMEEPPKLVKPSLFNKIHGSLCGLAIGDALGAPVEFRPNAYMKQNEVKDFQVGGTWSLERGQFTDDTSMALCLAISLVVRGGFSTYDQLVRYKCWYRNGYMSSTGQCFDIGSATRDSIETFENRQKKFSRENNIDMKTLDSLSDLEKVKNFDCYCSVDRAAGNGALMRLAPVPLFFHQYPHIAVENSGISGKITHGDKKAYDACRYYGALIVGALQGKSKDELLSLSFYREMKSWMGKEKLCKDVKKVAKGSFKEKKGYEDGIAGKGYIISALEAALWAFYNDNGSFKRGVLLAVNLGDDTDTTAAIYGQLAGAVYGFDNLPKGWTEEIYAKKFIRNLSQWLAYESSIWKPNKKLYSLNDESHAFTIFRSPPRNDSLVFDRRSQLRPTQSVDSVPSEHGKTRQPLNPGKKLEITEKQLNYPVSFILSSTDIGNSIAPTDQSNRKLLARMSSTDSHKICGSSMAETIFRY